MDTSILTAAAICLLVVIFVKWLLQRGKLPPGPNGLPIVGYIPFLSRKPYLDLQKLAKEYGNIFSIRLGSAYVLVLNDFESTKEAFSQDAFMGRPPESPFNVNQETLETGAFNGIAWKDQRRFSLHMLRDLGFGKTRMEGHIQEEINELLEQLGQHADKPFRIYDLLAPSMSNNIGSLVFGKRFKYDDPIRQMMTRVLGKTAAAAGQATWQLFFPKVKKICRFFGVGDVDRIDRIQKEMRDYTILLAPSMSNNIGSLVFGKRFKYDDPIRQMMTRVLGKTAAAAGQATWQLFFPTVKKMCRFFGVGDVDRIDRIQKEMRDYTILLAPSMSNNIGSLVFGKRFKYDDPIRQMMTRVLGRTAAAAGQATLQLFFPTVKKICRFFGIGDVDRIDRIQKEMRDYTMQEIEEHEKTLDPGNIRDYIDGYLLEIQKRKDPSFCKPVLQDLVGAFFGAGSETVRLSVEWLMLTAAVHQDEQRRIYKEISDNIGKIQPVTYMDNKRMPYTNAFIMELMRWRTIIPINVLRYTLADTELNGYFIPKNSVVLANLWAIHHDLEYWGEDAEQFKPERFLTDDGQEVKKWEHFVPFSIGKRACPGEPLAKIEIFLYFVSILQKFHVKVPDGKVIDLEGELGIGLMPKTQELIFTRRN